MALHFKRYRLSRKYETDIFNFFFYKPFHKTHVGQFLLKLDLERSRIKFTNPNVFRPDLRIPKKIDKPHSFFLWRMIYRNRLKCHFRLRTKALKALLIYPYLGRRSGDKHFINYFDGRLDHNMIRHYFALHMVEARSFIENGFMEVNHVTCPVHHHYSLKTGDSIRPALGFARVFIEPILINAMNKDFIKVNLPGRAEYSLPLRLYKFWASYSQGTSSKNHFELQVRFVYNISRAFLLL
jgi:hypothetical protein